MGEYQQMRDGNIAVRLDDGTFYYDTAANFVIDGGPRLQLPSGIDERIYTQGRRHALMRESNVIDGGPRQWPEGDDVIAHCADYINAQTERRKAEMEELNKKAQAQFQAQLQAATSVVKA